MADPASSDLPLKIGLGEAIQRLIAVERRYAHMHSQFPEELLAERNMIMHALNQFTVDLNMSCEIDLGEVMQDVHIFEQSVKTSCCRLVGYEPDTSRRSAASDVLPPKPLAPAPEPVAAPEAAPQPSAPQRVFDAVLGIWRSPAKKD